jgi:hypothetical protein
MKTEVYSWRLSADRKVELEQEARREGTSVAKILEQITADWLAQRRNGHSNDSAEQAAIRQRAMAAIGSVRGGDPTASQRSRELVSDGIYRKYSKETDAPKRRISRRAD